MDIHLIFRSFLKSDTCGLTTYCPRMAACKSKVRVSSKSLVNEATVEAGLGSGLWSLQKRGVEVWRLEERFLLNMGDVYSWRRTLYDIFCQRLMYKNHNMNSHNFEKRQFLHNHGRYLKSKDVIGKPTKFPFRQSLVDLSVSLAILEKFEGKVTYFWDAVSPYTIHGGQKLKIRLLKPIFVITNMHSKVSPLPGKSI